MVKKSVNNRKKQETAMKPLELVIAGGVACCILRANGFCLSPRGGYGLYKHVMKNDSMVPGK